MLLVCTYSGLHTSQHLPGAKACVTHVYGGQSNIFHGARASNPPVRSVWMISLTQPSLLNLSKDPVLTKEVNSLLRFLVYVLHLVLGHRPSAVCLSHGYPGCQRCNCCGGGHELATSLQVLTSNLWTVMVVGETWLYEATSADVIIVLLLLKEMMVPSIEMDG